MFTDGFCILLFLLQCRQISQNSFLFSVGQITKAFQNHFLLCVCRAHGVTFSTSQIFSILSADGFVPFLFQSLMVLCEIPVSSENSFWVTPFRRINSKIFSLIILYFTFSLRFCFTISQNSLSVTSSNAEKTPLPALCGFRIFFLRSNKKRNGNAWEKMRHAKKQPEFPFLHRNSDCFYAFCSASTS